MYTANTMSSSFEALGMSLLGSSQMASPDPEKADSAADSARVLVEAIKKNIRPRDIVTRKALENAALAAYNNPGVAYQTKADDFVPIIYRYDGKRFLTAQLPSGRLLYYPFPGTEPGKFGGLIDAAGARGFLVNLLERDDVGAGGGDDPGETDEVEFAVHPFAVVDVVGENAEGRDRGRRFGGGKGPDRVDADRDPHEEGAKEHDGNARR
jgi:hypothetical protein